MANAFTWRGTRLSSNTYAIDPNYKIGYAQTWTMALQQNLPFSFQTTITYTGVKGTDLDSDVQPWVTLPSGLRAFCPRQP